MNKSLDNFLRQCADRVWNYWEENNEESFLDNANKVGSFSDWYDAKSDYEIAYIAGVELAGDRFISMLRKTISSGINAWFED